MIYDYEIKKENKEEVLYIYLDFNSEFAKLKSKEKKKKLNEIIKDFIQKNKIKFDGKKIAIISGGLLIATIMYTSPYVNTKKYTEAENYRTSVVVLEGEKLDISDTLVQIKEETVEDKTVEKELIEIEQNEDIQSNVIKKEVAETKQNNNIPTSTTEKDNIVKKNEPKEENNIKQSPVQTEVQAPASVKTETSVSQTKTETVKEQETTIKNNDIYVTVVRKNGTIINLELEEYIIGVVSAEMPASFHTEALKAQSILARTYAMKAIKNGKTLTDDSNTQNYKSLDELKSMWGTSFNTYYEKVKSSVEATNGKILTYNGSPIEAVYHSTSNGRTENAEYVWGNSFPYLISVESPYDNINKDFKSDNFLTYEEISSKLGQIVDANSDFEILGLTPGNRVESISISGTILTGVKARTMFGLRSADFDIKKEDTGVTFTTRGYGHGVGMSQYGAHGMAQNGFNYEQILKTYYPGTNLSQK